jgi:hypothetical protein
VSGSLRGSAPGQLSLLEPINDPNDPNHLSEPRSVVEVELGEWARKLLRFAAQHHLTGGYAARVEQQLGCSATRYLWALAAMLDRPEVLAAEPELIGRLRSLRDRRQRLRGARPR